MENRSPKEDLLVEGLADWVDAGWALGSTDLAGVADLSVRRALAIGIIAEVIVEGLMVPGDADEQGHHPWPHSAGEAVERIVREWLAEWPDDVPTPGAVVWLANTVAGDEIGRRVLAREASAP